MSFDSVPENLFLSVNKKFVSEQHHFHEENCIQEVSKSTVKHSKQWDGLFKLVAMLKNKVIV